MSEYEIVDIQYIGGTAVMPTASVIVRMPDGSVVKDAGEGNGSVDAVANAIQRALNMKMELVEFSINAVSSGFESEGRVTVRTKYGGREYRGVGVDTDIIIASAKALVDSLNNPIPSEPSIAAYAYLT